MRLRWLLSDLSDADIEYIRGRLDKAGKPFLVNLGTVVFLIVVISITGA